MGIKASASALCRVRKGGVPRRTGQCADALSARGPWHCCRSSVPCCSQASAPPPAQPGEMSRCAGRGAHGQKEEAGSFPLSDLVWPQIPAVLKEGRARESPHRIQLFRPFSSFCCCSPPEREPFLTSAFLQQSSSKEKSLLTGEEPPLPQPAPGPCAAAGSQQGLHTGVYDKCSLRRDSGHCGINWPRK